MDKKTDWLDEKQKIYAKKIGKEWEFSTNKEILEGEPLIYIIIEITRKEIAMLFGMTHEGQQIYFERKNKKFYK